MTSPESEREADSVTVGERSDAADAEPVGRAIGHGLYVVQRGGRTRLEARDVPRLREMVGNHLLIAFGKSFIGADRLESLNCMLKLNYDHTEERSLARERNVWNLVTMIWGAVRETAVALNLLKNAGIVGKLNKDITLWAPVDDIRMRWDSQLSKDIRNNLAFHGGDTSFFTAGLDGWSCDNPLTIFEGELDVEGVLRRNIRLGFGTELLLSGMNLDADTLLAFAEETKTDQYDLSEHLQRLFAGVLEHCGVQVSSEPKEQGGT